LLPAALPAATVLLSPVSDAVIYSPLIGDSGPLANGAGDFLHAGVNGNGGGNRTLRSLLRFDPAAVIPAGATVTQVVLRVHALKHSGTLEVRRVTEPWSEGTDDASSGEAGGTSATEGSVTWEHATYPAVTWTTAGATTSATLSASASATVGQSVAFSSSTLIAEVQDMLDFPALNHGWRLENTDQTTPSNSIQMASRTHPTEELRPVLEVGYTLSPLPVLYYDFEEGAGTVLQNRGTLGGIGTLIGAGGDERWVSGPQGGALAFDGENAPDGDYIATHFTSGQLGLSSSDYTAAAWIHFSKATGDCMVFSQTNASSVVLHHGVRNSRVHQGHWSNDLAGNLLLQTGVWYHVVWEYREGHQRIFINGQRDNGPAARGPLANASEVTIGRTGYANGSFQGLLDEVVVFDRTLALNQIRHLAAGGSPLNLPTEEVAGNPTYFTAPFGPGGTWNLYQFRGVAVDRPRTWAEAEAEAVATVDPSGLSGLVGHLADVTQRQENFFLSRIAAFQTIWIGLTDNEAYGGTEAGNGRGAGWVWTSGTAYGYQNWNTGEPNNATTGGEDAVQLLADSAVWNDHLNGAGEQTSGAPLLPCVVEWAVASPTPVPGAQVMAPIFPETFLARGPANAAFGVTSVANNGAVDNVVRAVASLQSGTGTRSTGVRPIINATDPEAPGPVGLLPGDQPMVGDTPVDDNAIVHLYQGRLVIDQPGTYTFGLRSDDASALRIRGQAFTTVHGDGVIDIRAPDTVYRERVNSEFRAVINLPAGQHDIEVLALENGGGASHELYAAPGAWSNDTDTPFWRAVGHRSRGNFQLPGIKTVSGTNWWTRTTAPGGLALNNLAEAEAELAGEVNPVLVSLDAINLADPQNPGVPAGHFVGDVPFPNDTGGDDNEFAFEAIGVLEIPADGLYQFGFRGDDGGSLQIVGQAWSNLAFAVNGNSQISGDTLVHDANSGNSHTRGNIFLEAGEYTLRALFWEHGGGGNFEVYGDVLGRNHFPDLLRGGGAREEADAPGLALAVVEPIQAVAPDYDRQTGLVSVSWNSMPDASYRVEWSTDHQTWHLLQAGVSSQGAVTTFTFVDAFGEPFVLFRVVEE
jgi:hypothetical protein